MAFRMMAPKRSVREDLQIMEAMAQAQTAAPRSSRLRSRLQVMAAVAAAVGVLTGVLLSRGQHSDAAALRMAQQMAGTWELKSVNADPVGPRELSVVVLQKVTFENGRLHGDTRLRANTPDAITAMPFPDESAKTVTASTDGRYLDVTWEGTYTVLDSHRIEFQIGKAIYRAEAKIDAANHTLEFDHDTILTYPGTARYRLSG